MNIRGDFFKILRYINRFGFINGLNILVKMNLSKKEEFSIKIPGYNNLIYLRRNISDFFSFKQAFVNKQYNHKKIMESNPKYIIDAGANVGYSSLFFASVFPDAKIIAIEPEKSNFDLLIKNTSGYKNIECIKSAIWSENKKLKIKDINASKNSFQVERSDEIDHDGSLIEGYTIDMIMDMYNIDQIDILKMDIEGAEKQIFSNDCELWINKVAMLVIELHDRMISGCSKEFYKTISNYNFEQYFTDENVIIKFI